MQQKPQLPFLNSGGISPHARGDKGLKRITKFGHNEVLSPLKKHIRLRSRSFTESEHKFLNTTPDESNDKVSDKVQAYPIHESWHTGLPPLPDTCISPINTSTHHNDYEYDYESETTDTININTTPDPGMMTASRRMRTIDIPEDQFIDERFLCKTSRSSEPSMGFPSVTKSADRMSDSPMDRKRSLVPHLQSKSWNQEINTPSRQNASKLSQYRTQCSQITDWLFVAGENVAMDAKILSDLSIRYIINAAGTICKNFHEQDPQFQYQTLYIMDNPQEDIVCLLYDLYEFIEKVRSENERVLIHCQLGVSRSTALCIGYLMLLYNKDYEETYQLVRHKRGIARPNVGFICQLLSWRKRVSQECGNNGLYHVTAHSKFDTYLVCKRVYWIGAAALDDRGVFIHVGTDKITIWIGSLVQSSSCDTNNDCHPRELLITTFENIMKMLRQLQRFEHAPNDICIVMSGDTVAHREFLECINEKSEAKVNEMYGSLYYSKTYDDEYGSIEEYIDDEGNIQSNILDNTIQQGHVRQFLEMCMKMCNK